MDELLRSLGSISERESMKFFFMLKLKFVLCTIIAEHTFLSLPLDFKNTCHFYFIFNEVLTFVIQIHTKAQQSIIIFFNCVVEP